MLMLISFGEDDAEKRLINLDLYSMTHLREIYKFAFGNTINETKFQNVRFPKNGQLTAIGDSAFYEIV